MKSKDFTKCHQVFLHHARLVFIHKNEAKSALRRLQNKLLNNPGLIPKTAFMELTVLPTEKFSQTITPKNPYKVCKLVRKLTWWPVILLGVSGSIPVTVPSISCLPRRRSFGSSRNLSSPTKGTREEGKDCVTRKKSVCERGYWISRLPCCRF